MRRITHHNVELIQETIEHNLAGVEKQLGVSINVGLTTFTPHNAIFKLETAIVGDNGETKARKVIVGTPEEDSFMVVDRDTGQIMATGYTTVAEAAAAWPNAVNVPATPK